MHQVSSISAHPQTNYSIQQNAVFKNFSNKKTVENRTANDEFVRDSKNNIGTQIAIGASLLGALAIGAFALYKGRGIKLAEEITSQKFKEMGGIFKKGKAYINGRKVTGTIVFNAEKGTKTVYQNGKADKVFKNNVLKHFYNKDGSVVINTTTDIPKEKLEKLSQKLGKKVSYIKVETKFSKYFPKGIDDEIKKLSQLETPDKIVAQGSTVEQRVNNFLNDKNYSILKSSNPPQQMPTYKLEPHRYNTASQNVSIMTAGDEIDYARVLLKNGGQKGAAGLPHITSLPETNSRLVVGRTPEGRAFVEYALPTSGRDFGGGRTIRETGTIISNNGEFTPAQIDLIKVLGSNPQNLSKEFPLLRCTRHLADKNNWVASEDVLLSGIHTMAKNTPDNLPNRFLSGLNNLKNGEFLFDINHSGRIMTEQML